MNQNRLPFPYGLSQFTTQPWSFEQDVENYASLGVEAIEVAEVKLDPSRVGEQLSQVQAAGLTISSVQPTVRTMVPSTSTPKPESRQDRLTRFRHTVEQVAPYAPGAAFVTNTGPAPGGNMADAIAQVIDDHKELAAVAADHGVRIALEPLNPVSLNQETAIWTYQQALDIVTAVDRDEVGICVDLWNLWQDSSLITGMQNSPDRIFLLQVSDWRTPPLRHGPAQRRHR